MSGILQGIRVLDFGRYIGGPFCATLLADLGAEVIRIEKPDGGEDRYTVPVTDSGEGAYFIQLGRNKRGMTLNPTAPLGRAVVERLVRTADVVVVNLPPPALKKLGLDYASLKMIKPDIILTTSSAFGSVGPYSDRGGFDTVAQAMSGNLHLSGLSENPGKSFAPYCDFGTASLSAFGTLAALIHRMKTGQGQVVEANLLQTGLTFNNAALIEQAELSLNRVGTGVRGQYNAPTDAFSTRDGRIMVQLVGQGLFRRWAKLLDENAWLEDERFSTDQLRGNHGQLISERMAHWCALRTSAEAMQELAIAGIPCGEVLTPQEVLDNEHISQCGAFQWLEYPGAPQPAPVASHPVQYSQTPVEKFRRAPLLGEHTEEILHELGYSEQEIAELRAEKII